LNKILKQFSDTFKNILTKTTAIQKGIIAAVILAVVFSFFFIINFSSTTNKIALFSTAIQNDQDYYNIIRHLEAENYVFSVDNELKMIYFDNIAQARSARAVLVRKELIPNDIDPWEVMDQEKWTITDFERNVNLQRAITKELELHILALDDVDSVSVIISQPKEELFKENQKEVTASIRITPKFNSDLAKNEEKVKGIVKLVKLSIPGLEEKNITIIDNKGTILNSFQDRIENTILRDTQTVLNIKTKQEQELEERIRKSLTEKVTVVSPNRISVNVSLGLNVDQTTSDATIYTPMEIVPQDPNAPYNTRQVATDVIISRDYVEGNFQGQGFSPWGPPGQEGQVAPEYADLTDLIGKWDGKSARENMALNQEQVKKSNTAGSLTKITAGILVDGTYKFLFDDKGNYIIENGSRKREYVEPSIAEIAAITSALEGAMGIDRSRGDVINVSGFQFDRLDEFRKDDDFYFAQQRKNLYVLVGVISFAVLVIGFVLFRFVSSELERRKRLREQEEARQAELLRQQQLLEAQRAEVENLITVESRTDELIQQIANVVKERPDDVAKLMRTWMLLGD